MTRAISGASTKGGAHGRRTGASTFAVLKKLNKKGRDWTHIIHERFTTFTTKVNQTWVNLHNKDDMGENVGKMTKKNLPFLAKCTYKWGETVESTVTPA